MAQHSFTGPHGTHQCPQLCYVIALTRTRWTQTSGWPCISKLENYTSTLNNYNIEKCFNKRVKIKFINRVSLSDYTGLWPFRVVAVSVSGRYDLLPCDQIAYRLHVKRKRPCVCTYCGNLCLALYMKARGMHIYIIYDVPYPMTYVYMLCLSYFVMVRITSLVFE